MADPTSLAEYVRANSYPRVPNETRQDEGWSAYKKGYDSALSSRRKRI